MSTPIITDFIRSVEFKTEDSVVNTGYMLLLKKGAHPTSDNSPKMKEINQCTIDNLIVSNLTRRCIKVKNKH